MSSQTLPDFASVVVIGGGAMGCSTLYHLAKEGVTDAILIERDKLTSGTTWHSAAQVRALRSSQNLTNMIRYSSDLYASLEEETGQSVGWINSGSISIATNPERLTHIRRQEALSKLFGLDAEVISSGEVSERWPLANIDDVEGAVFSPTDGRVSPSDLCAALAKGAKRRGARVFENTSITGIETRGGRVVAVITEQGRVRCDSVAICAGLWSRKVAAMGGVEAPLWPCEHFYLLTKPVEGISGNLPTLSDHDGHLYIRDDSGGLLVGCFEPMGKAIDPERLGEDFAFQLLPEDWDHFEPMMLNALHRLPVLETAGVRMLLNGPESFTPDGMFMLGETAETVGLYLGCGMNSMGIASSGGAGMALAHEIAHGRKPFDLHEADPTRFPACLNSVAALSVRAPEVLGKHYEITFPGRHWSTARDLVRSPLAPGWSDAAPHLGQFFGIERPLYFGKERDPVLTFGHPDWFEHVGREVRQTTEAASLFDQSSLGKIEVSGPGAATILGRLCTRSMEIDVDQAVYALMLTEDGGILADLTVIRLAEDIFQLLVGAAAVKRLMSWIWRHSDGAQVEIGNASQDTAIIALAGPLSEALMTDLGSSDVVDLGFYRSKVTKIADVTARATRLSYVGETGWEIQCAADDGPRLYGALRTAGAGPAGLFAQTSMRIEKRFLAYGADIDTDTSPIDAGLAFAVKNPGDFMGRAAFEERRESGAAKRLVTILFDDLDAEPLGGEPVFVGGDMVGKTTSAAFGYRVGAPIALALISSDFALEGSVAAARIGARDCSGRLSLKPGFDPAGSRMRTIRAFQN